MKKIFAAFTFLCLAGSAFADDLTFTVVNTIPGSSTGSIDMNVSGGIAPFTYSWSGPGGFTANTEDLSGLATGTYTITVTDHYCGTATAIVFIDASTGIDEKAMTAEVSVYPNPGNGEITVASDVQLKNATVKLIDLSGKTAFESSGISGNSFIFNVSGQAKGIYFVEINNEGVISRKRFVKN